MVPDPRHRAFTLVETMVSIGIIMLLIGVTVPALQAARLAAQETAELNLQRQSGMAIVAYADDHDGAFPYYGIPGTDFAPLRFHSGPRKGDWIGNQYGDHWGQMFYWAYWLIGLGYEAESATYFSTGEKRPRWGSPDFDYLAFDALSPTVLANPTFFAPDSHFDIAKHGGQRSQHVASPSVKGILKRSNFIRFWTMEEPISDEAAEQVPFYVWFADGHGAKWRDNQMRKGVEVRSDTYPVWSGPVYSTVDGIRGRDL